MNDPTTIITPTKVENNPKSNTHTIQPSPSPSSSSNSSTMTNLHSLVVSFLGEKNNSSLFGTKLISMNNTTTTILTPGNILFCISIPFCYRAYRDYSKFLKLIQKSPSLTTKTTKTTTTIPNNNTNPNQLGMMVASHALGIATRGSIGIFALMGSFVFYINDWSSLSDAIQSTQQWAHLRRQRWITLLGIKPNHYDKEEEEEYIHFTKETQHMSEEEQWNYLQKKYFSIQEEEQQQ